MSEFFTSLLKDKDLEKFISIENITREPVEIIFSNGEQTRILATSAELYPCQEKEGLIFYTTNSEKNKSFSIEIACGEKFIIKE